MPQSKQKRINKWLSQIIASGAAGFTKAIMLDNSLDVGSESPIFTYSHAERLLDFLGFRWNGSVLLDCVYIWKWEQGNFGPAHLRNLQTLQIAICTPPFSHTPTSYLQIFKLNGKNKIKTNNDLNIGSKHTHTVSQAPTCSKH